MKDKELAHRVIVLGNRIELADRAPMLKKPALVMDAVKVAYSIICELVNREVARNDG